MKLTFFRKKRGADAPVRAYEVAETCARGSVRPDNQDHLVVVAAAKGYCVADGMGGGAEGGRASEIVCARVAEALVGAGENQESRVSAVRAALVSANAEIFLYARRKGYEQMGSTAVVLLFDPQEPTRAHVIHIGDSRVYRIRGGLATPLTRDHSIGFALGDVAGRDAAAFRSRANPLAHVLTRAIGGSERVQSDLAEIDVKSGDRYVLCSDGVHDVVSDARLAVFAGGGSVDSARKRLAEEIEKAGAPDNYSFILISVQ